MAQRVKERTNTQNLQAAWEQRVRTGNFSAAITGMREVRVFGKAGDAPVTFPQLRAPAPGETLDDLLEGLAPDERWALTHVQRVIDVHRASGRQTFTVPRGQGGMGTTMPQFDPCANSDILIVSQITGG
jgi:hypothetical protein